MTTKTKRMTVARFVEIHGETPLRVRTNGDGVVWAVRARPAGTGHAPHYALRDFKAHAWAPTLAELSALLDAADRAAAEDRQP